MAIVTALLLLLLLAPLAAAQWQDCDSSRKYTPNSTYQANLRLLSSSLPRKAASNATLFATATAGDAPDIVYALTLCRGDTNASTCESCVATAFQDAQQLCEYNKDVALYYEPCMLSFSDKDFLANTTDRNKHVLILYNRYYFRTSDDSVWIMLLTLINSTAQSAANSSRRFTTSRLEASSFPTLYCAMQCTPDLTADDCAACFQHLVQIARDNLDGPQGGRVLGTRCNMRYEIYSFYQGDPMLAIQAANRTTPGEVQTTVQEHHGHNTHRRALWIISIAAPSLSILLCLVWRRRRRKDSAMNRLDEEELVWILEGRSSEFTLFDFVDIGQATHNFSKENLLGQGGFGPVYKGQLPDETEIAVKRLAKHSGQGFTEFRNEVGLIAKLQHNNLVKLLGCCIQGEEKLLVYEYMPNKSLDFFIFDEDRRTLVDWNTRCEIIEGIGQGLMYLHKHSRIRIIHRDLKASNILLDKDMNPKISDFGLAKIFSSNDTKGSTNRVVGTYGYMSPEYAYKGIYSIKSDVFSFGVLLLEILSGKKNSDFHQSQDFTNLLQYSWQLWEGGRWLELVEVSIVTEINTAHARRYINIALMCVQENADDRPTMSTVVAMLNNESVTIPYPNQPAYFNLRVPNIPESTGVVIPCSNNDVTITEERDGR